MDVDDRRFWIGPAHEQMCRIKIGSFRETFALNLEHWSLPNYMQHWRRQLELLVSGAPVVVLTKWAADPDIACIRRGWVLFASGGDEVTVVERLFICEPEADFSVCADGSVQVEQKPALITEEGLEISSWKTGISEISAFLASSG